MGSGVHAPGLSSVSTHWFNRLTTWRSMSGSGQLASRALDGTGVKACSGSCSDVGRSPVDFNISRQSLSSKWLRLATAKEKSSSVHCAEELPPPLGFAAP